MAAQGVIAACSFMGYIPRVAGRTQNINHYCGSCGRHLTHKHHGKASELQLIGEEGENDYLPGMRR